MDADPRTIQQIIFEGVVRGDDNTKIKLCTILEQWKETVIEFYKKNSKSSVNNINGWIQ